MRANGRAGSRDDVTGRFRDDGGRRLIQDIAGRFRNDGRGTANNILATEATLSFLTTDDALAFLATETTLIFLTAQSTLAFLAEFRIVEVTLLLCSRDVVKGIFCVAAVE